LDITKEATAGGDEYRFENDALVAFQMATEHIMIMIKLTCDISRSEVVDYRNQLTIYAKHITIQPKDMQSLLRELWHSIDPTSPNWRSNKPEAD
jgi:histone H3/H4